MAEPPRTTATVSCGRWCWRRLRNKERVLVLERELPFPSFVLENRASLNPFPEGACPAGAGGSAVCVEQHPRRAGQVRAEPPPAAAAGPRCVPLSPISAERAWKMRQGPGSHLCRQGPHSTGVFPGWQQAPLQQLSQFRSRELFHSSPASASPCSPCSHPADSSSPMGTEQLWGGGGRNQPVWGVGWEWAQEQLW